MSAPQLFFFGDSLTDDGNLYTQADGLLDDVFRDAASGYDGRASDGPTWAEHLALMTGQSHDIYAVAGAEAYGSQSLLDFAVSFGALPYALVPLDDPALQWDMNLSAQLGRFQTDAAGWDLSASTAYILVGGNDYGALREVLPALDPLQAIVALAQTLLASTLSTLAAALELSMMGMEEVVVVSMPEAEFFPAIHATGAAISGLLGAVFDVHNDILEAGVDALSGLGANISFLDIGPITGAIAEDATQFGLLAPYGTFTNTLPADYPVGPDQVAFWDDIHPSGQTHELIAQFILAAGSADVLAGSNAGELHDVTTTPHDTLAFLMGGDDIYIGNGGANTVFGGSGNDTVFGGISADTLSGGAGANQLFGYEGDDIIALGGSGSEGDGGYGNDLLILQSFTTGGAAIGNFGDDLFATGLGTGTITGGAGDDTILIFVDQPADLLTAAQTLNIDGGDGYDELLIIGAGPLDLFTYEVLEMFQITTTGVEFIELYDSLGFAYSAVPPLMQDASEWGLVPDAWTDLGWIA